MIKGKKKIAAIILAGGESKRISGNDIPKQLIKIADKYLISFCLDIYQGIDAVDDIVLVFNENYRELFDSIIREGNYRKVKRIVPGGKYRQNSILNGISAAKSSDFVIIQNGVSVLTPRELIYECLRQAEVHTAVSAFVREIYSSFTVNENKLELVLDRDRLGHVRDPQVIETRLLYDLHKRANEEGKGPYTNDVFLLKEYGQEVHLIESPPSNFKITTDIDIKLARLLLQEAKE
jgi:2-C-methyl-D-erythritol 4-phosphate cytidylyltransferase